MEELVDIEKCELLKEMIIFSDGVNIAMEDIYKLLNNSLKDIRKRKEEITKDNPFKIKINSQFDANIISIDKYKFSFNFLNIYKENLFIEPIHKIIDSDKGLKPIDIISLTQIKNIAKKYEIYNPCIFCNKCRSAFSLISLNILLHKTHNFKIIHTFKITKLEGEENFKKFFRVKKLIFNNVLEFEKNFNDYFNLNRNIDIEKEFEFYTKEQRELLFLDLKDKGNYGNKMTIFGESGIGKSIAIIHSIKYGLDHNIYKILYIHCKYLSLLEKEKKYGLIKQKLVDEIPYLFYGDYESYKECCKLINKFEFSNINCVFTLVDSILDYENKKKKINNKYIICFDQYNDSCDRNGKINDIIQKILGIKELNQFFLFLCLKSMNNKDVKSLKVKKLLNSDDIEDGIIYEYINDFIHLAFEKSKYENYFQKLGKNIKIYNELSIIEESKLEDYYNMKKEYYRKKLLKYFNENKNDDEELQYNGMKKMLSFSVDVKYNKEELENIIQNIPFKYYQIEKNNSEFQISYKAQIIEEVAKEIYYQFIYNNNNLCIALLKQNELIKGGSKGCLFEQFIVNKLSPQKNVSNAPIPDIVINEKRIIPKFIPRDKETKNPYVEEKIKLEKNKIYLIEQKIFGGKSIDFGIIDYIGEEPIIFAFQIGIIKEIIFSKETLKKTFKLMKEYLNNFFEGLILDDKNIYFGYIFSLIFKDKNEYKNRFKTMINNCIKNNVGFSFYDIEKNIFTDESKRMKNSIFSMAKCPFIDEPLFKFDKRSLGMKQVVKKNTKNKYDISINHKKKILAILKKVYEKKIDDYKYSQTLNKRFIYSTDYGFYFFKDKYSNSYIITNTISSASIHSLDKIDNKLKNIEILNEDFLADCYDIYVNKKKINGDNKSYEESSNEIKINLKKTKKNI